MKLLSIYICLFLFCISCSNDDDGQVLTPNDLNDITSFSINGQQGAIDNNTITLQLDTGTDITALTPNIEHTGLTIVPDIGAVEDFTEPVVYTVVAENGDTQEFTINVTVRLGTASGIEFITTWSANEITIHTNTDFTYNYNVDWNNDGVVDESGITGDITHTFDTDEEHTIRITGTFPAIRFIDATTLEASKIISVDQWGTGTWLSMEGAFADCSNLEVPAIDVPDLSNVSSLRFMFIAASIANPDVSNWDISNVTDLLGMFFSAGLANPDVSAWDTANVTDMSELFATASAANPDISNWNISNVTKASRILDNTALSTENYDKLLISFANQTRQNDVVFGASRVIFCSDEAAAARATLISESNWDIRNDSRDPQCE
ncbi:BspA family leucine-rich repeat surface protein [Aquimarina sp. BL5]|uniref:BspA family leucine-rich repeat surface protein n=1 Tax=Aquimarina sp. BL5 TaxID=1714860 RepID=UPI000E4ACB8F|nr:BspA family leucine-rich repeat surface protein [Aquimarina sp. BL5]AXT50399.1 BspA family leucine-rich repeat surface protein [Aquimarina sp. BL5]RKM90190.1 BspA family leucine-rich repeat surface protein [Aquimarina sp. BL5]